MSSRLLNAIASCFLGPTCRKVGGIVGWAAGAGVLGLVPVATGQSIPLSPAAQAAGAQVTYSHGIEFVTVGSVGNPSYQGGPFGNEAIGRGSVGYEYRIGHFEVTTAQWVEFFNAAYDRPQSEWLPHMLPPTFWGAVQTTPNTPGGMRWRVPAGNEMRAVGDISWRMAAMYCNWLHNDKSLERSAFLNGAYDVSTFGYTPGNVFTDQLTHHPGARFWIPTLDEKLKASHFDPNRFGPDQPGWWTYNITSETRPIYARPGLSNDQGQISQANAGFTSPNPFVIPLGAYPTVQSPWGLLDVAGATGEWTEEPSYYNGGPSDRVVMGSIWNAGIGLGPGMDAIYAIGSVFPSITTYEFGFRIAAAVPSPSSMIPLLGAGLLTLRRRRRSHDPHPARASALRLPITDRAG